ncbi:MAG: VTT domain-containing protein [Candidatus Norongarragalinales archaeon]
MDLASLWNLLNGNAFVAQATAILYGYGLFGLFLVCFFSASLFPFPSEPVIVLAVAAKFDLAAIFIVVLASSTIAAYVNYWIGLHGLHPLLMKKEEKEEHEAEKWIRRWGAPILVASPWIPFIGDLFPVAAGALKMSWQKFLFWIIVARTVKTAGVIAFALGLFKLIGW